MTLEAGTKLGPYEIVAPIGAGGMGEVYRAKDTRLEREVAVKILPEHLADLGQRKARFEREAKTISRLSHSHICTLYDLGEEDGISYLVMELLEGQSLAERLLRGPLPLDETLRYGIEIAEALEAAHKHGITHRDLKPGNVMLTKGGVKLLDFGLAKYTNPGGPGGGNASLAPTLAAASSSLTAQGTLMGTFQYMAPEQLEGEEADARSDIFAFGCVLYEMATGQPAFSGKSQASLIGAILKEEPAAISSIQAMTPPAFDRLVQICLAKDPDDRFQTAHDVKLQLQWIAEGGTRAGAPVVVTAHRKSREELAWASAAVLFAALLASLFFLWKATRSAPPTPMELSLDIPSLDQLDTADGPAVVISPDGKRVVYVMKPSGNGDGQIYVRELGEHQARALDGVKGSAPFFSPDGREIGFVSDGKLEKVSVFGGVPVVLCGAHPRGGSWGKDGTIVFTPGLTNPLSRISANGGAPQQLTHFDGSRGELTQRWPQILPSGKDVIFTASSDNNSFAHAYVEVASLATGNEKVLVKNAYFGRYLPSGYLTYVSGGTLFAAPFDAQALEVTGAAMPVEQHILANLSNGSAQLSASATGTAVYLSGKALTSEVTVALVDRTGVVTPLIKDPGDYYAPRFSPDGKLLALQVGIGNVSIFNLARKTLTPLTHPPSQCVWPTWTPDGKRIVCETYKQGTGFMLSSIPTDGSEKLEPITKPSPITRIPYSWSPDGSTLAFFQLHNQGDCCQIWKMPFDANGQPGNPAALLGQNTPGVFVYPSISPDGHWLAYMSTGSGSPQIYVRPFPSLEGRTQISTANGQFPRWSRTSHELFFQPTTSPRSILSVSYRVEGTSFQADNPTIAVKPIGEPRDPFPNYDVAPDGKHFVILEARKTQAAALPLPTVVLHWSTRVRKLVSGGQK